MTADDFCRTELLAIMLEEIEDKCLRIGGDGLFFDDAEITIDYERWAEIRSDWRCGLHGGDCLHMACSCSACYWAERLADGDRIALAFAREAHGRPGEHLLPIIMGDDDPDDSGAFKRVADKLREEAERAGLIKPTART